MEKAEKKSKVVKSLKTNLKSPKKKVSGERNASARVFSVAPKEAVVYSQDGKVSGKFTPPESVFGLSWNADLVHQVLLSMQSNARSGAAHTKDRREVSGGGKRPWKQKGTGRARHSSIRSPLWKGGGVTHGPRNERNYKKKINKKMKAKALFTMLSAKFKEGRVLFVDKVTLKENKTKFAYDVLKNLSAVPEFKTLNYKKANNIGIFVPEVSPYSRAFRNLPNADLITLSSINPINVFEHRYLVIVNPEESARLLEKKLS